MLHVKPVPAERNRICSPRGCIVQIRVSQHFLPLSTWQYYAKWMLPLYLVPLSLRYLCEEPIQFNCPWWQLVLTNTECNPQESGGSGSLPSSVSDPHSSSLWGVRREAIRDPWSSNWRRCAPGECKTSQMVCRHGRVFNFKRLNSKIYVPLKKYGHSGPCFSHSFL